MKSMRSLRDAVYALTIILDREELLDRYFAHRTDGLKPWGLARLVVATVPSLGSY